MDLSFLLVWTFYLLQIYVNSFFNPLFVVDSLFQMENKALISVIVPSYNAAPHLQKCINSIKKQIYENWELIIVNDGSEDNTIQIVETYMLEDRRIRLINKENGGVSSARNSGIESATGDWIVFVDADDYVQPRYLSAMIEASDGCDLVVSHVTTNASKLSKTACEYRVYNLSDGFIILSVQGELHPPCAKLVSRKLLLNYGIRFIEKLSLGEDLCFNLDYLEHCSIIAITSEVNYKYETENSTLSKAIKKDYAHLQCYFFGRICGFAQSHGIQIEIQDKLYGVIRDAMFSLLKSKQINYSEKVNSIQDLKKEELFKKYIKENKSKSLSEMIFRILCKFPSQILALL